MGRPNFQRLRRQFLLQGTYLQSDLSNVPDPDFELKDGDRFEIGSNSAEVLFTPGHSPGHLALYFDVEEFEISEEVSALQGAISAPFLIAGDTLFAGSIGRTDLPGGNHEQFTA